MNWRNSAPKPDAALLVDHYLAHEFVIIAPG